MFNGQLSTAFDNVNLIKTGPKAAEPVNSATHMEQLRNKIS